MSWKPPLTFEEKLKRALIPPSLYIRYLHAKQLRSGEPEFRLIPFLANKARVSLDVGAHKGAYSFALLKHSQAVHAFEPNPKMFDVLESWARDLVTLHPSALSNVSGAADLLVPRRRNGYSNQGSSLSAVKVQGEHATVRVKADRLDDCGIDNVGFIKIDVEGFEAEALQGLSRAVKALSFEFTTIQRDVALACIERCIALGYTRFNAALGESQALVRGDWVSGEEIANWLTGLPHAANSGDIYAALA